MTISTRTRSELFTTTKPSVDIEPASPQLIRLPLTRPPDAPNKSKNTNKKSKKPTKYKVKVEPGDRQTPHRHGLPWTTDEHDRFLQGLERYPCGPWKAIAAFVGTRTPRQTMTHAQKYRQKIQRRRRGLLTSSRQPVPVTSELYGGLTIAANVTDCDTVAGTPTSVDVAVLKSTNQMAPLESNWFDKVEVCELDAAFQAFLEVYDPIQFPIDDGISAVSAFSVDVDCNVSMDDGASIVL
ncbi:hypothetical protein F442_20468 [Phytophthora nicotianae P10297]|uniref:Uncharacterized protein n=1 Tax=Phytophthora nicotianae P10297 TaxID=1317064 RepID=W2Y7F6_PHYNI|nr:hypothetical protein F442_20468 [Phytophthora nicotianae P10297]